MTRTGAKARRATSPAHFVYIVRCADGSLYTGWTTDPAGRTAAHNAGRGARYTRARRPVRLVYTERCSSRGAALSREYAIKQWPKAQKEAHIRQTRKRVRTRRRTLTA